MPLLVTMLLVAAVHLLTNVAAWRTVGLLADDRFSVGLPALLQQQGTPFLEQLRLVFCREFPPDQPVALYRPFVDLSYLIEYPLHGANAVGYHVTNSVLHCATAVLWSLLLRRLSGSTFAATAAAVAFAGWPGHSEATHWIAARTNLLSTFWLSLALLAWLPPGGARRWPRTALAALCAVIALGCKETAILVVPMLLLLDWLRAQAAQPLARRLAAVALANLPVWLALGGWLALRARVLHTFGTGTKPPWQLDVLSPAAWLGATMGWLQLLFAPVHAQCAARLFVPLLWVLHGILLGLSLRRRGAADGRVLWFALGTFGCGLVAIAGLPKDVSTLENVRYTYETALPFAALLGLGLSALPGAWRWPALLLLAAVHVFALDQNRDSWLRAGALRRKEEAAAFAAAAGAPEPLRVLDVPSVYLGAFVQLVADPSVFAAPFAPAPAAGRGRASPDREWRAVLQELADRAATKQPLRAAFAVGWADGALLPLPWDDRWPVELAPGTTVRFARLGRARPFAGTTVPVQVLLRTDARLTLTASGSAGETRWTGPPAAVEKAAAAQAVAVSLPLPAGLAPETEVAVELRAAWAGGQRTFALGTVTPAAFTTRP